MLMHEACPGQVVIQGPGLHRSAHLFAQQRRAGSGAPHQKHRSLKFPPPVHKKVNTRIPEQTFQSHLRNLSFLLNHARWSIFCHLSIFPSSPAQARLPKLTRSIDTILRPFSNNSSQHALRYCFHLSRGRSRCSIAGSRCCASFGLCCLCTFGVAHDSPRDSGNALSLVGFAWTMPPALWRTALLW